MHACSAIAHQVRKPEDYCHGLLSIGAFNATYEFFVNPTASQEYWEKTENAKPVPPPSRRSAGRPKRQRRKDGNEASGSGGKSKRIYNEWTCSNCSGKKHSKRGCANQGCIPRPRGFVSQEEEAQPQPHGVEAQPHPPEVQEGQTQAEIPLSQSGPVQEQLLSQEVPNIVETSGHRQKVLILKKINLI
jgi:hypothetical protein